MMKDELVHRYASEDEIAEVNKQAAAIEDWLFTPQARQSTWELLQEKIKPFNAFHDNYIWRRDQNGINEEVPAETRLG